MRIEHCVGVLVAIALPLVAAGCSRDRPDDSRGTRTSGEEREERRVAVREADRVAATREGDREGRYAARDGADDEASMARDERELTAGDQSENAADLEITRHIRAAVMADSSLSFGARNCTIITRDGVVTLRGEVSGVEAQAISGHAQRAPGVSRVENGLSVTDRASAD